MKNNNSKKVGQLVLILGLQDLNRTTKIKCLNKNDNKDNMKKCRVLFVDFKTREITHGTK